jgi:hypothetical protein
MKEMIQFDEQMHYKVICQRRWCNKLYLTSKVFESLVPNMLNDDQKESKNTLIVFIESK